MVGIKEGLKIKGVLSIYDAKTRKLLYRKRNLVVNGGLNYIVDRMKNNTVDPFSHIAIGTGTTGVTPTDTQLQTEIIRKTITDMDTVENVLTVETEVEDYEAVAVWKECGIFNASSGGVMFNRINIDFDKTTEDAVIVQFTITLTTV